MRKRRLFQASVFLAVLGSTSFRCSDPTGDDIGTSELVIYGSAVRQGQGVPDLPVHVFYRLPCPVLPPTTQFLTVFTDALGKYRIRVVTLFIPTTVVCWRATLQFTHPDSRPDSLVQDSILFPTQIAASQQDSLKIDFALP